MRAFCLLFSAVLSGFLVLFPCCRPVVAQTVYPNAQWQAYQSPAQAGWSVEKLAAANRYADSIGTAAVLVVYRGAVLASWGDVERKYLCHSMRKSFLSALYGMSVRDKQIDNRSTLAQLGVDDAVHPLTVAEKQATVQHLLEARSGVFLPAAYEGNPQKPARGSHPPGTFWLYNNWDFNTLGTILERKTKRRFFDDLQQRIARPLQMQDVDSLDAYYDYELERSQYPAYTFKMSARDLARFGWLYANNGAWKGQQLVPASWVRESTQAYSVNEDGEGYGYLWWVDQTLFKDRGMYSAAGLGGHHIFVFPKDELVVVVRVDTYASKSVSLKTEYELLTKLFAARAGKPVGRPALVPLPAVVRSPQPLAAAPPLDPQRYVGRYQFEGEWMEVRPGLTPNGLLIDTELMGKFYLQPISESLFVLKDQGNYLSFIFDKTGKAVRLIYHDKSLGSVSKQ